MINLPEKSPILIVDDDEGLLFAIRAALLSAGLPDPALTSDSRTVCDLMRAHRFHLVLLDLIMPHLDGLKLLQMIKEISPATECIIVTAVDEVDTRWTRNAPRSPSATRWNAISSGKAWRCSSGRRVFRI